MEPRTMNTATMITDTLSSTEITDKNMEPRTMNTATMITDTLSSTEINQCVPKMYIVFILDSSTYDSNYNNMKSLVNKFLQTAKIDCGEIRVGLMIYGSQVTIEFQLNTYDTKTELIDAVDKIPWRYGGFNPANALKTMHEEMFSNANGDRPGVRNICVMMTGGILNINDYITIAETEKARDKGIHIYAIGIALEVFSEVIRIASQPASLNTFAVDTFDELENLDTIFFESNKSVQCFPKIDLVFILDSSTSIGNNNYDKMKAFVKKLIQTANIDCGVTRVGLVSYSTQVTIEFHLNTYNTTTELIDAVDKIPWRYGSTNTADALKAMHEEMFSKDNGDRPGVRNVCIFMTDGVSNINYQRAIPEAETARQKDIHIYAIGIRLKDLSELNGIASQPASLNAFAVDFFNELEDLDTKFFIFNDSVQCFPKMDLVFILDSSTSIGYDYFNKMTAFVKKFLQAANIVCGETRVGLMSYSTRVTIEFQLNTYDTKTELIDAVDKIPWRYGSTNTADALKTMHEEMFSYANGDRPGVQNICIIMTDGVSNINNGRTIPEAEKARKKGIHIYAIGIALKDLWEVNDFASQPGCLNAFVVDIFDDLEDLDKKIFKSYCSGQNGEKRTQDLAHELT
ncbi:cartilage matrix protein-like isoform X2 [Saccostrea cucullata]|uniref:cartilage matrix protein-like isoform X2 n=1 Tax=Saccostrea cuccullata TaxID=36930 RepID=UPI002ED07C0D